MTEPRLAGFSNPQSPTGRAALVDPLPHHISTEAIQVVFEIPPEAAQRYLPDGLEPTEPAMAFAFVGTMEKLSAANTRQHEVEPERTQYTEGLIGLYCRHGDDAGRFNAFIWVDKDWSMAFGHFVGLPKKLAEVHRTRVNDVNPAMAPLGSGTTIRGQVTRLGTRLLDVGVTLRERIEPSEMLSFGPWIFAHRVLPSPSPDVPTARQLFRMQLSNVAVAVADCWSGDGQVALADGTNEELEALRPGPVRAAYHFRRGWTIDADAELIRDDSGR